MSVHSDDAGSTDTLSYIGSGSFWEPGNFKWTTKRIEDGNKLCNDYVALLQERAELEKNYAKNLRSWSKKWEDNFDRGPEYSTTKEALKGTSGEANRLADLHMSVRERILEELCPKVRTWQKDNYHKSLMQLKEKKEMDDRFRKEQKPWEKLYNKVNKARTDYHNARKSERTALNNQLNASRADPELSPEAPSARKAAERVEKAREVVAKTRVTYEASLREIEEYNPYYVENMTKVFEACQEVESVRLRFIKEILYDVHSCLDISSYPELPTIYTELVGVIDGADFKRDLRWWSQNRGVDMPMNWPKFEEYTEEFRDISNRKHKSAGVAESTITLINQRSFGDDLPETTPEQEKKASSKKSGKPSKEKEKPAKATYTNPLLDSNKPQPKAASRRSNGTSSHNKITSVYEDEEWDENLDDNSLTDNGEPGVTVKALYDYEGVEKDELSFKTGDVFQKLEDEDEQGWCKGRMNGKVGLYPANYVDVL